MKTNAEIQQQAQRMIEQGRVYRDEARQASAGRELVPLPRVLVRLPDSAVTIRPETSPTVGAHTVHRQRHIEVAMDQGDLVYRLVAKETERDPTGNVVRESPATAEMESGSGVDLLHAGYEQAEAERISEAIFPFLEDSDGVEPSVGYETVAKVEEILETNLLAPSEHLRAKADIVEFLDGRLEASAFVAQAIDRQCAREDCVERRAESRDLRMTIENP